jgi:hypothetical protein
MGRIYIILGAPASIESFELTPGIYPCQVWYYYGDKAKGLLTPGADEGLRGGQTRDRSHPPERIFRRDRCVLEELAFLILFPSF